MVGKNKIIVKKEKGTNRHWKNFLDKNYLGSHNLEEGEELLVTIQKLEGEEKVKVTDGKTTTKPVLYFKEEVPKMIMNITNGNTITSLYGSHPDGWIGKQIQIFTAKDIKGFGKTNIEALRIRDFKPKAEIDSKGWMDKLSEATTLTELATIWKSLPLAVKTDPEIEGHKNTLKVNLTPKQ